MATIPEDNLNLLNLSEKELHEVESNLRNTLISTVSYFKKYANHTSNPITLQDIIIEEITKLNIIKIDHNLHTAYWNNQIYKDSLYSCNAHFIDSIITSYRVIFTEIHIEFNFLKNEYIFKCKFRKDVVVYQSIITHLHISYDTKKVICDYYDDETLEYSLTYK